MASRVLAISSGVAPNSTAAKSVTPMSANAATEANRKKTVEMANAVTVNNSALKTLAEDFGTVSSSESAKATREAQMLADSFATRLSGQVFQGATDWVGLIESVDPIHVRTL
jgi:hypothetical protein